jgi:ubiquinone/menaquinone biosynthesis C-methylase UbiE
MGMNEEELQRNPVLTEFVVKDLNVDPKLPYGDDSFDVITNVVSVDYLTRPLEIFQEMHRVLKPGGLAIMSFSNRCFPTKGEAMHLLGAPMRHLKLLRSQACYLKQWLVSMSLFGRVHRVMMLEQDVALFCDISVGFRCSH